MEITSVHATDPETMTCNNNVVIRKFTHKHYQNGKMK